MHNIPYPNDKSLGKPVRKFGETFSVANVLRDAFFPNKTNAQAVAELKEGNGG